uniref:Uncharacterized protein n=1 Tax=Glossina austeni TaxID=7395 RepID=A0A1A9UH22_GLOAU
MCHDANARVNDSKTHLRAKDFFKIDCVYPSKRYLFDGNKIRPKRNVYFIIVNTLLSINSSGGGSTWRLALLFKAEANPQNFFKNFSIDKTRRRTLNMLMKAYDDGDDDIQVQKRKK